MNTRQAFQVTFPIALAFSTLLAGPASELAGGTVSGDKARALWKFKYNDTLGKGTVNDFHIRLVDPTHNINVLKAQLNSINAPPGQSIAKEGTYQNNSNNSKQVDIDFAWDPNFDAGQEFSLFLSIQQKKRNQVTVQNAYFTKDNVYAGGPGGAGPTNPMGLGGFKWEDPELIDNLFLNYALGTGDLLSPIIDDGADGVANSFDDEAWQTIYLFDLKFYLNQPDYDLSDGDDSFFDAMTPDLVIDGPLELSPGSELPAIPVTGWERGTFIWLTGLAANSSDLATATYVSEFTFGHETANVPEPASVLIVSIASVAIFGFRSCRRTLRPGGRRRVAGDGQGPDR